MIEKVVHSPIGPLQVTLHSLTSAAVYSNSDDPTTVNRVQVAFRADIRPSKVATPVPGKCYVDYLPTGPLHVEHLTVSKVDGENWGWTPSWAMRDKIEAHVLEAVNALLADPTLAHQVEADKASQTLARAQASVEQAEQVLAKAKAEREGAADALNKILSSGPTQLADLSH